MLHNNHIWRKTGVVGTLPLEARLRLKKAAATENPRERIDAINDADLWVRTTYPEYFKGSTSKENTNGY